MPRQDVPYSGAICRLKERIAEIWDKLGEKLHSVNGVTGDAAGNVEIVSGDAAITISDSQAGHYIEIGLDHGALPSAAVTSINGQTGAVTLDAGDIPSDGNSDVQTDIDVNKAAISACSSAITSEQLARQNADSALQTNINAALASIPEISVTPDPYKGIERDAQGRAFAADPASGATDKSLTTANWISQTGAGKPNNLLHDTASEEFSGLKTAGPQGFIRKRSATFNLTTPPAGTITDENYVMMDVNGTTAVQIFNSYTKDAQTIFQIASKYPFVEEGVTKVTNGMLWIAVYNDHVSLFLRFVDKNGGVHMTEIARQNA